MIKNIVFDVGNVLVSYDPQQYMKNLGYDDATRKTLMKTMFLDPLWDEVDRSALTVEELISKFTAKAPECESQIKKIFEKIEGIVELMPYAVEWVADLKNRGYHLYIISNYGDYTYEETKHKMKFLEYMDGVVFSFQYKIVKPEREIYEKLLEKYELKAEECVFIDDRLVNIEAAKKVGYHGILLSSYKQAKEELNQFLLSMQEE